jgi:alanyl-tRNA synthetase
MSRHLHNLELAKHEIIRYTAELDQKKAKKELTDLEYKILLAEKLHRKDKDEIINHINTQIHKIKQEEKTKRNVAIAAILTLLAIGLALVSTLYSQDQATGYAVKMEQDLKEKCDSYRWSKETGTNIPSEEGENPDPACSRIKELEEKR